MKKSKPKASWSKPVGATKTKIVYNQDYGGFGLSFEARRMLAGLLNITVEQVTRRYSYATNHRHCPMLVHVVEALGDKANGGCADLAVIEINDTRYYIDEYDGAEAVRTPSNMPWVSVHVTPNWGDGK
jgi:hypothetical protein